MVDISELFKLSPAERIQLAVELWDSVAADASNLPPLSEEEWEEIRRRLEEHDRDPATSVEWSEFRDRLLSKLG